MDNESSHALNEHKLTPNQMAYIKASKTPRSKLAKHYGVSAETIDYHRSRVNHRVVSHHRTERKVKVEKKASGLTFSLEEETFIKSLPVIFKNAQGNISFEVRG